MLLNSGVEKTLESPLDCKEIKSINSKGNQSWICFGRTDAEAETPILWLPDAKSWLIRKDPDAGKDWRQEEKGMTEDEMVGWHHWLDGHEFEQALGDGEGQGSLACCSPQGHKDLNMTEQANNNMYTALLNKTVQCNSGYNLRHLLNMTILSWTISSLDSLWPPPTHFSVYKVYIMDKWVLMYNS